MPTRVLDTQLFVHQNFQHLPERNRVMREDPFSSGLAVEKLLLYDELALPTLDFGIVPMLFRWFGRRGVDQLLDEEAISFVRPGFEPRPGTENRAWWLAYVGNGAGVQLIFVGAGEGQPAPWEVEAAFAAPGRSLELQLASLADLDAGDREQYVDRFLARTAIADGRLLHDRIMPGVLELLRDESLRTALGFTVGQNLQQLPGIAPNQVRILGDEDSDDSITALLILLTVLSELEWAHLVGATDTVADPLIQRMLAARGRTLRLTADEIAAFRHLREIERIPDIPVAVSRGSNANDLLALRSTRSARDFRRWLAAALAEAPPEDIAAQYVDLLKQQQALPTKIARFVVSSTAGLAVGALGAAAAVASAVGLGVSALDAFVGDRAGRANAPRVFLDDLRRTIPMRAGRILNLHD